MNKIKKFLLPAAAGIFLCGCTEEFLFDTEVMGNTTIVGLSAALGVGISQSSSALSQFLESITIIFGKTPVVIATIMAVLLNLILPQENTDQ